jgi:hypothetical protein
MVSAWKGTAATVRECMGCRISQWYAGYFAGDVFTNGTYVSSDERAKQNIADLTGAMKIINQLHPKRYQYRQDGEYGQMNLPRGDRHGLIAQEVEQVLPGLVKETVFVPGTAGPDSLDPNSGVPASNGSINFKALNYTELIPILIKAIQEQQQQIDALNRTIEELGGRPKP